MGPRSADRQGNQRHAERYQHDEGHRLDRMDDGICRQDSREQHEPEPNSQQPGLRRLEVPQNEGLPQQGNNDHGKEQAVGPAGMAVLVLAHVMSEPVVQFRHHEMTDQM